MKLQGRNLSIEMRGEDVRLLQMELAQIGFQISPNEIGAAVFGPSTLQAVKDFQKVHGLPTNGIVESTTAAAINQAVDALHPAPPSAKGHFVVHGTVRNADGGPALLQVRALDRELRHSVTLGVTTTNKDGTYQIAYSAAQLG